MTELEELAQFLEEGIQKALQSFVGQPNILRTYYDVSSNVYNFLKNQVAIGNLYLPNDILVDVNHFNEINYLRRKRDNLQNILELELGKSRPKNKKVVELKNDICRVNWKLDAKIDECTDPRDIKVFFKDPITFEPYDFSNSAMPYSFTRE